MAEAADNVPQLSIVVIVYRMARQAMNTLYTLSARFQREVSASDYEIVVVENSSDSTLDEQAVRSLGGNFRYFCRENRGVSPAEAINFGLSQCRAPRVGLMIDGARMVTPRIVRYAQDAFAINEDALVAVPGYHLGDQEQNPELSPHYDEVAEQQLMETIDWRADGYRLFDIACVSPANPNGAFQPFMECNCMFASRRNFELIGDADERFQLPGGGALNLHMFRSLGLLPQTRLFVLPGEGSFHQFHGGVTTSNREAREQLLARQSAQLAEFWPSGFHALRREAIMLGAITGPALPMMEWSAQRGQRRHARLTRQHKIEWPDEPHHGPPQPVEPPQQGG